MKSALLGLRIPTVYSLIRSAPAVCPPIESVVVFTCSAAAARAVFVVAVVHPVARLL